MYVHVRPPSAERYRPLTCWRAEFAAGRGFGCVSASTTVYMMSGLLSARAMLMRPFIDAGKPPPFTSVHVAPASVVFQSALPGPPLRRKYGPRWRSQLDAQSTSGLRGSIATSMKPALSLTNFDIVQVRPPSVVLYRPRSGFVRHVAPAAAT